MDKAIVVKNITKRYQLYSNGKERLLDLISPKRYGNDFYALRDVGFEAEKGDVVGFIGINGSGKSTLSNIIAGIVPETTGTVSVNGETAIIAVEAGLRGDLTGRDNIELKCLMLGFTKKEIHMLEPDIIEFSELGHFIDQPVKSYSSGMRSRLGFAISVHVDPEILIIDEALSVGDRAFAEKSLNKMKEFKKMGKTMIFVSHSIGQMWGFCEKILWLEFGYVKDFGTVGDIMPKYEKFLDRWQRMSKQERQVYKKLAIHRDEKALHQLMEGKGSYSEEAISRIGHIRGMASHIYTSPKGVQSALSPKEYKHSAYYIKRQVTFNHEVYVLLSKEPSAMDGVIGWMKSSGIVSHPHIYIDSDPKQFIVKGTGEGYDRPWGGRKNLVFTELCEFKGHTFQVKTTEKIGNNFWYYGMLKGDYMWIHESHVL